MYLSFSFEIVGLKYIKVRQCVIIQGFMIIYHQFSGI